MRAKADKAARPLRSLVATATLEGEDQTLGDDDGYDQGHELRGANRQGPRPPSASVSPRARAKARGRSPVVGSRVEQRRGERKNERP